MLVRKRRLSGNAVGWNRPVKPLRTPDVRGVRPSPNTPFPDDTRRFLSIRGNVPMQMRLPTTVSGGRLLDQTHPCGFLSRLRAATFTGASRFGTREIQPLSRRYVYRHRGSLRNHRACCRAGT